MHIILDMRYCNICGKEITYKDDYTLFGCDGNFVHYNCLKSRDTYFMAINNINDNEFKKFITGEKELNINGTD